MGLIESTFKSSQLIGEAKQYMWAISPEPLPQDSDSIAKQIPKGVQYRILSPQPPIKLLNLENRTTSNTPVVLVLTEKEGALCFRFLDGRIDYAGFIGDDPTFLTWVKELFLYYWIKENEFDAIESVSPYLTLFNDLWNSVGSIRCCIHFLGFNKILIKLNIKHESAD